MIQRYSKSPLRVIKVLFIAGMMIITITPFVWVVIASFKTNDEILFSALSLPAKWSLDGYVRAFSFAPIPMFYKNSILVSAATTLLDILLFSMASYVLARIKGKIVVAIIALLSMSLYIPVTALVQPIFSVVKGIGLYNRLEGLVLINLAMNLAISVFILRGTFIAIPYEVEESSFIDGAGILRTFFTIVLPIARPGLVTVAILCFINSWNQFLFPLVLTSRESNFTLPVAINYFTASFRFDYPALFAALTVTILPTIIVFFALSEQIMSGMAGGAVKG